MIFSLHRFLPDSILLVSISNMLPVNVYWVWKKIPSRRRLMVRKAICVHTIIMSHIDQNTFRWSRNERHYIVYLDNFTRAIEDTVIVYLGIIYWLTKITLNILTHFLYYIYRTGSTSLLHRKKIVYSLHKYFLVFLDTILNISFELNYIIYENKLTIIKFMLLKFLFIL